VLFVDIDGFDGVNETRGHEIGDRVLLEYALRVKRTAPLGSVAMRFGADQIVLGVKCSVEAGQALAQRLVGQVAQPFDVGSGDPVQLSASVGVAAYPVHGARPLLVSHASTAARSVKQAGGGSHAVFDPKVVIDVHERAQLLVELRQALALGQFELFYQPKIDARSLQVTAAEALIRWRHPVRGIVSPGEFIPLAERHGLIGAIGNWVIDEACRQAGAWRQAGLRMRVAINLSAYQMRQDDFVDRLLGALAQHGLQPGRFTVEITESLALENTQATQHTFARLRDAGLHVAIDDFGAGQTSIAYLRELPASELKLDIALVRDLEHSAEARTIAEAMINLAHALNRRVVAEGVESEAQRDLLVLMGCDELQGFLFARPMSAKGLGLWAMDERPSSQERFRSSLFRETIASSRL
jgi:diguanylate cyclase (GGDEF)-like protein